MDAYEATRIVFSRVQSLDPENATKIMGYLLIQDHGEKEMIRLAFGPETTLHSVVLKARKELGLASSTPVSPSAGAAAPHTFLLRQNSTSGRILPPSPLAVSSPSSWAPPTFFSRSNSSSNNGPLSVSLEELQSSDELISPNNPRPSPFYNGSGAGDIMDEFHLQEQLSFLNDPTAVAANSNHSAIGTKLIAAAGGCGDIFFPDVECRSPSVGNGDSLLLPYGMGWGVNGQHRRSCSAAADLYLGSDATGLGWKPCLYFARGYCKNGTACRFLHGMPDETTAAAVAAAAAGAKMDAVVEQQCQELLLRSKNQRIATGGGGMSQLMASAFPYSPTGSVPPSPSSSSKCLNFLLQQQQNESQRAAAAAAAAALMLGGDESHKFMGRSRLERDLNPGSRQIYLTFPADSTFREEDVSNYFSIYGPVQDVRIPYQQKRMFGFVTFVYPETVKLILAKGNPHFVCDARVLVKPYKEKGKVPDKYRNKQHQQSERGDYCSTPTGLVDSRDPFDLHHLGARMLYNNGGSQELLLRRRLEEQQQQQALELQQAIELQRSRFMGLQLLDLKSRSLSASAPVSIISPTTTISTNTPTTTSSTSNGSTSSQEESPPEVLVSADKSPIAAAAAPSLKLNNLHGFLHHQQKLQAVNAAHKEESIREVATPNEDSDFPDSAEEHNLPDSPFASPTKSSVGLDAFSVATEPDAASSTITTALATSYMANNNGGSNGNSHMLSPSFLPPASTLDMASLTSRFFQMPRFSSGHGAAGL